MGRKRKMRVTMRRRPIININGVENELLEEDRTTDILNGDNRQRNLKINRNVITKAPRTTTSTSIGAISAYTSPQVCECNCRAPSFVCPQYEASSAAVLILSKTYLTNLKLIF